MPTVELYEPGTRALMQKQASVIVIVTRDKAAADEFFPLIAAAPYTLGLVQIAPEGLQPVEQESLIRKYRYSPASVWFILLHMPEFDDLYAEFWPSADMIIQVEVLPSSRLDGLLIKQMVFTPGFSVDYPETGQYFPKEYLMFLTWDILKHALAQKAHPYYMEKSLHPREELIIWPYLVPASSSGLPYYYVLDGDKALTIANLEGQSNSAAASQFITWSQETFDAHYGPGQWVMVRYVTLDHLTFYEAGRFLTES